MKPLLLQTDRDSGDSMLDKIDENRQQGAKPNLVQPNLHQNRFFRGATIDAMKDFPSPYLKRSTTNKIFYVGPKKSINYSSNVILNKLLYVNFSNIIDISDNGIAKLKIETLTNTLILTIVIFLRSTCMFPIFLNRHGKG